MVLRMQLGPAVLVLYFWGGKEVMRARLTPLIAGTLIALVFNGIFDSVTWNYPFEPHWNNLKYNIAEDTQSVIGTMPWWGYPWFMGAFWGGTMAVLLPLALVGARRAPLLLVLALVILVSHSFVGHKEYRFMYPATLMLATLAGFGLYQLVVWIANSLHQEKMEKSRAYVRTTLSLVAAWTLMSIVNAVGQDYMDRWDKSGHEVILASRHISTMKDVCGVGLYGSIPYHVGGYSYIHTPVPLYWDSDHSITFERAAPGFNVLMDMQAGAEAPKVFGYDKEACFGSVCLYRRQGQCEALPQALFAPNGPIQQPFPSSGIAYPPSEKGR